MIIRLIGGPFDGHAPVWRSSTGDPGAGPGQMIVIPELVPIVDMYAVTYGPSGWYHYYERVPGSPCEYQWKYATEMR